LIDWSSFMPNQVSGGQQQRLAIARALVTSPTLILADEPTGNLDTAASADVLAVLDRLSAEGRTIIMITHEHDIAAHAKRQIHMVDGRVTEDNRVVDLAAPPPLLASSLAAS